jgi:PAS domain S-box-containing protein
MIHDFTRVAPVVRGDQPTMIGHSIADVSGRLLTMDESVADFLQRSKAELRSLSYMDITHPDDRHANANRIDMLSVGDTPLRLRKRYILPDGKHIWSLVQVSKLDTGADRGRLVGTIFSLDFTQRQTPPEKLWAAAKRQIQLMATRNAALGGDLFADTAWSVLLCLYLAEAEGRGIDAGGQSASVGVSALSAAKWLRALRTRGLVEYVGDGEDQPQLTQRGIDAIESLLAGTIVRSD